MGKRALVLEGGSLRCMFAAGIIDVMMENDVKVDGLFGVSAGAFTGINYVSNQPGRTKKVNVNFSGDRNYYGIWSLIKNKTAFNMDYLFGEICDIYMPLDRETFMNSEVDFTAAATNCETGEAEYFSKRTASDIFLAARASASMPLLQQMVEIDGKKYLDGGITVPIPYQRAIDEGYERMLVIPSREHGYRKTIISREMAGMISRFYKDYPKLVSAFVNTPKVYSDELDELDRLEAAGRAMVIRPAFPVDVSRTEKDATKLIALYREGRKEAEDRIDAIKAYLK